VPLSVPRRSFGRKHPNRDPADSSEIAANQPKAAHSAGKAGDGATASADQDPLPQCPAALAEVLPKAQAPQVMGYVQVIVSLLEGRRVSLEEIWQTLLNFWRQRTIALRRKNDHTVAWLNAHPP
jgi:hypothetical protein